MDLAVAKQQASSEAVAKQQASSENEDFDFD